MLRVVGCFVDAHDYRLVLVAAAICALSAFTAVELLRHARGSSGILGPIWLTVAAVSGGCGIWATHFVAMLAFEPGLPSAYDLGLTAISLGLAIVLVGAGLGISLIGSSSLLAAAGGGVVGGGIAAMHYTGMAAFEVPGQLGWDRDLVIVSILLGMILGAAALVTALAARSMTQRLVAALLLLLAIVSHHFTAMGAVTITPDPTSAISPSAIPTTWLALAVTLASCVILLLAGAALALDIRDRRRAAVEGERLRSLANAAVEGLLVCQGEAIVSANQSFAKLVGFEESEELTGLPVGMFLPDEATRLALASHPDTPTEAMILNVSAKRIPVELVMRRIEYANAPHYALAVRDLRARRRHERQIQFLAHHDALTGLANRTSFNKRLDQEIKIATQKGTKLAILCLDLDRFKEVNDLFGHAAGDAMLENVARLVTDVLEEDQMMARLGGDEFAILAPCEHAVVAGRLTERILDSLRSGNRDSNGPVIASSVGIAMFPDDSEDRHTLLSYADTALYRAKSEGRGTYRFFEPRMGIEVRDRRMLEHELRHAVARGEMSLVYQPQTDITTKEMTGFEALLRWHHPTRGSISPAVFIPIAEESGVILQIGEWVLREACRVAAGWKKPLGIAVNVSTVQIHSSRFVRLVHEVLFETGLKPERLEIEITETALIRDPDRALLTLRQVKALGVRIAMDDFGTGYSSLSNLRTFPFDKIKIDASFIRAVHSNDQAAAIVRSVLGLGKGLGLPILAEGVESAEELDFLESEQCHAAQGYLIGRPAPIDTFKKYVGEGAEQGEAAAAKRGTKAMVA